MRKTRLWLTVLGGISAVNAGCIMLETEIPDVCFQEQDLVIEVPIDELIPDQPVPSEVARAAAGSLGQALTAAQLTSVPTLAIQETFASDGLDAVPDALDDMGAEAELYLRRVRVGGDPTTFLGVERVAVSLVPDTGEADFSAVELAVCDTADGCDVTAGAIDMVVQSEEDLLPLLREESAQLMVELVVRPTTSSYRLDLDVCMGAKASFVLSP